MYRWSHLLLLPGLIGLVGCGDGDNDDEGAVSASITTLYSSGAVKGEKGLLRIALGDAASKRTKVSLSSSAPDVIDLPSSVTFPEGRRSLDVEFDANATGTAAIKAAVGETSAMTTASVVDSLQFTDFSADSSAFVIGSTGVLNAYLNSEVAEAKSIQVSSSAPDVVSVEESGEFAPFDAWAPVGFSALAVGHAEIIAEFDGTTRAYGIEVVERANLQTFGVDDVVQVGTILDPYVYLTAASSSDSVIAVSSDQPDVVAVPGQIVVSGGDTGGSFSTVAAAPGTATLKAEYEGSTLSQTITVVEDVTLVSAQLGTRGGVSVGGSASLFVGVDALVARDVPVSISVDKPEILSVPESLIIQSGEDSGTGSITGLEEGTAEITVTLGDSTRTLQVEVVNGASVIYVQGPSSMVVGSSDELYVELDASAPDAGVTLTSSDPEILSVTQVAYASTVEGRLVAHKAGTATITIRSGDDFRYWYVSVQKAAALAYASFDAPVVTGGAGELTLNLTAPAASKVEVTLESSNPSVLEVPSTLTIPAETTYYSIPLLVGNPGYATLSVTLGKVTMTTEVVVIDHPTVRQAFVSAQSLVKGENTMLGVYLSARATEDLELNFTYEVEGIVSGPAKAVIPAGSSSAQLSLTAKAVGMTTILVEGGGDSVMTRVNVVDKLELMVFDGQGTEAGKSSTYYLELNAFNTEPVTITLESDDPDVASVPASVVIPAGAQMASVLVKGVSEGTATLKATYGDDELTVAVNVFAPPPPAP